MVYLQFSNHTELKTEPSQHSAGVRIYTSSLFIVGLRHVCVACVFLNSYSQFSLRGTLLGPAPTVHLKEVSSLRRVEEM